jgi:hypothetical protein
VKRAAKWTGLVILGLVALVYVAGRLHPAESSPAAASAVESSTKPVVPIADHPSTDSRKWAGLTAAQATRQAIRDSYVEDVATGGPILTGNGWMENPTASEVKCHGEEFWKLDYGDMPSPYFESKPVGLNGGCDGELWIAHPARVACVRNKVFWNARASETPTWWDMKRRGLRCQSEWHQ